MSPTPDITPDQTGRVAVITGPHCPRGRATAVELATLGAHVVLMGGDIQALSSLRDDLQRAVPAAGVTVQPVPDPSVATTQAAAQMVVNIHPRIDLVVFNTCPRLPDTAPPLDEVPAVALPGLGHLATVAALMPALFASEQARIVTVTPLSDQHEPLLGTPQWHDYATATWGRFKDAVTEQDIVALTLLDFALELHRHLDKAGSSVVSVAVDPGLPTSAIPTSTPADAGPLTRRLTHRQVCRRTQPQLRAATDPTVTPGARYQLDALPLGPREGAAGPAHANARWEASTSFLDVAFRPAPAAA